MLSHFSCQVRKNLKKNLFDKLSSRLEEARKLLERSISEQRKQAASIIVLRLSMEKALLQHSAMKIRLRQQTEKASSVLSCWDKERRSLKKQLGEVCHWLKVSIIITDELKVNADQSLTEKSTRMRPN